MQACRSSSVQQSSSPIEFISAELIVHPAAEISLQSSSVAPSDGDSIAAFYASLCDLSAAPTPPALTSSSTQHSGNSFLDSLPPLLPPSSVVASSSSSSSIAPLVSSSTSSSIASSASSGSPVEHGVRRGQRGYDLLLRAGWKPGQGLGRAENGQLQPCPLRVLRSRAGLGSAHHLRAPLLTAPPLGQPHKELMKPCLDTRTERRRRERRRIREERRLRHVLYGPDDLPPTYEHALP
mmetsp:Transcript_22406/g.56221  ORF Transcript_22406/g.56221 Transcript_22406/m.56221 type:complete len:237 (+) Transcript_22406:28-738(+)